MCPLCEFERNEEKFLVHCVNSSSSACYFTGMRGFVIYGQNAGLARDMDIS